jgi:hypothetical protein
MKKLLIAAGILVIIVAALLILSGIYADRILDPFVRSVLEQNKPMNHKIEYGKIKVNLLQRFIKVRDVKMTPVPGLNKDENIWMEVTVSTIRMTNFDIRKMLFDKALSIGDINILQPDVIVHLPLNPPEEIIDSVQVDRAEKAKKQALKSISLERFLISGGSFTLIRNNVILASSPSINLVTDHINVIKNSADEPIGYTYNKLNLTLSDIALHSESGLYDMSVESFSASKEDSTIVLNGFRMIPKYDKKEFVKKLEFQTDRFDLVIGKIELARIGIEQFLTGRPLKISAIIIDSLFADIFRDKNVPFDFNRFPLFYNESFMKIGLPVILDSVMITNSRILYNELAEGKSSPGEISLDDFTLSIYNLTNLPPDSNEVREMRAFVNAKVMGEGNLTAEIALPLEGNMHDFECTGSVGSMQLSPLNGMLEPSLNISFNAGKLNRMTFYFSTTDVRSNGWMEFLYQDLDVVLHKKEAEKSWGFVSMLANTMALSNNPAPGKDLKIVEIGFERDKNKGIINYVWKTIQSGMVRTILPVKKYQINRKSAEKVKSTGNTSEEDAGGKKKKKK